LENKGGVLNALGRYDEALVTSNRALGVNQNSSYAWNYKGNALYNLSRYDEALTAYDHAMSGRIDSEVWYNRGRALSALGRYPEAVASFDNALTTKPNLTGAELTAAQVARNSALQKQNLTQQTSAITVQTSATPVNTQQQTKSTPLLYAPIGAIILTVGIAVWGRRQ
jgi:tetratricopeptide (TPR) repeat protein